jgi:general secretion pathway protein K
MIRNERGFALVLTLVITALLVALAVEFVGDMYVATTSHHTFVAGQQAGLMAESGAKGALQLLQLGLGSQTYTSRLDPWAKPFKVEDERGALEVVITEESALLNLNSVVLPNGTFSDAPHGMLLRLLRRFKLPEDLVDSLADWIDADGEPRPGGGETAWYQAQQPPVAVRNGYLETVEELAVIRGFTPAIRQTLAPLVTVYSDTAGAPTAPVNINTAPREILAVLDEEMTPDLAERIEARVKTEPLRQPADLAKVPGLETIANRLALRISVKGSVFRVVATARVGDVSRVVEAVARITGGTTSILYWREY